MLENVAEMVLVPEKLMDDGEPIPVMLYWLTEVVEAASRFSLNSISTWPLKPLVTDEICGAVISKTTLSV